MSSYSSFVMIIFGSWIHPHLEKWPPATWASAWAAWAKTKAADLGQKNLSKDGRRSFVYLHQNYFPFLTRVTFSARSDWYHALSLKYFYLEFPQYHRSGARRCNLFCFTRRRNWWCFTKHKRILRVFCELGAQNLSYDLLFNIRKRC